MLEYLRRASVPTDLLGIIAEVRRRWRLKLALRGVVRVLAILLAFFLVAAVLMQWDRFSPVSIVLARVLLALTLLTSVYFFLIQPLRRRVTDEQVADLRARFGDAGVFELTYQIGVENMRARMNTALGITEQGFSSGDSCRVPWVAQPAEPTRPAESR